MSRELGRLVELREALRMQSSRQRDQVRERALAFEYRWAERQKALFPAFMAATAAGLVLLIRRRKWRWAPAAWTLFSVAARALGWIRRSRTHD